MPNTILEGLLAQKGYGKDKRPDLKGYDNRQMIEQVYKYRSHLNAYQYAFVSKKKAEEFAETVEGIVDVVPFDSSTGYAELGGGADE